MNTLKASDDSFPQSREILQTFSVWWGARTCPHHALTSVKFVSFRQITFKLVNFIDFKAFFLVLPTIEVAELKYFRLNGLRPKKDTSLI